MSTIIFRLTESQERELEDMMKKENYTMKSEFFRFLMKFYTFHSLKSLNESNKIMERAVLEPATENRSTPDENLSDETRKMLANPYLFDEEVRQLIREMDPLYSHTPLYIEKRGA